jgi:hypothetical protein
MLQWIKNIAKGLRTVKKYGSLALTILDIIGYSAEKLEKYADENKELEAEK